MRDTLFEHALELFAEKGYKGASMRELAKRSGTTPSNVYNYFASKEDLLREVFRTGAQQIGETLDAGRRGEEADLASYLATVLETIDRHPLLWRMIHQLRYNDDVREILDSDFTAILTHALEGLRAYTSEPWLLLAIVDGLAASRLQGVPQPPDEDVVRLTVHCMESLHEA